MGMCSFGSSSRNEQQEKGYTNGICWLMAHRLASHWDFSTSTCSFSGHIAWEGQPKRRKKSQVSSHLKIIGKSRKQVENIYMKDGRQILMIYRGETGWKDRLSACNGYRRADQRLASGFQIQRNPGHRRWTQ